MRSVLSQSPPRSVEEAQILLSGRKIRPSLQKPLLLCLLIAAPQPGSLQQLEDGDSVTGSACRHAGGTTEGGLQGRGRHRGLRNQRDTFAEAWSGALVRSPEMGHKAT